MGHPARMPELRRRVLRHGKSPIVCPKCGNRSSTSEALKEARRIRTPMRAEAEERPMPPKMTRTFEDEDESDIELETLDDIDEDTTAEDDDTDDEDDDDGDDDDIDDDFERRRRRRPIEDDVARRRRRLDAAVCRSRQSDAADFPLISPAGSVLNRRCFRRRGPLKRLRRADQSCACETRTSSGGRSSVGRALQWHCRFSKKLY